MKNVQKGFTLIELMIVVAIIAILSAIAIPQYQKYIAKTQMSRVVAELGSMRTPFEICMNNNQLVEGTAPGECNIKGTLSNLLIAESDVTISTTGLITGTMGNTAATSLVDTVVTWSRSAEGNWVCEVTPGTSPGFTSSAVPKNCTVL